MLTKIAIAFLALTVSLIGATGVAVQQSGILLVQVEDKTEGLKIRLPVPVFLIRVALAFVPDEELEEARRELERVRPVLQEMLKSLEEIPDARLVEVENRRETVLVSKQGHNLIVEVETPSESVYVRIPVRGVRSLVSAISER